MPKKLRTKNSDYLRFRPYRAFTSPVAGPANVTWGKAFWRAALIVGAVALVLGGALWRHLH
jgi:anti-sigma-K factor RskA